MRWCTSSTRTEPQMPTGGPAVPLFRILDRSSIQVRTQPEFPSEKAPASLFGRIHCVQSENKRDWQGGALCKCFGFGGPTPTGPIGICQLPCSCSDFSRLLV